MTYIFKSPFVGWPGLATENRGHGHIALHVIHPGSIRTNQMSTEYAVYDEELQQEELLLQGTISWTSIMAGAVLVAMGMVVVVSAMGRSKTPVRYADPQVHDNLYYQSAYVDQFEDDVQDNLYYQPAYVDQFEDDGLTEEQRKLQRIICGIFNV